MCVCEVPGNVHHPLVRASCARWPCRLPAHYAGREQPARLCGRVHGTFVAGRLCCVMCWGPVFTQVHTGRGQIVSFCQQFVMRPCSSCYCCSPPTTYVLALTPVRSVQWCAVVCPCLQPTCLFLIPWACDRTSGLLQGCVDTPGASLQHYLYAVLSGMPLPCFLVAVNHRSALLLLCCVVPAGCSLQLHVY